MAQVRRPPGPPDALFITLTYPAWYPSSVRRCKAHLAAWQRRVKREYPTAWFYWKLEFQVRGAPHFHLLMFGAGTVIETWFHDAWFDVVSSGEHFHWFYGTRVDRLHTWNQAGAYCAKYCAKEDTQQVCDGVGRFWGIANRRLRPANLVEAEITDEEFYRLRRLFKRYMHQRSGYHAPGGPTSGVWTRISAGTAKRALAHVASAPERLALESIRPPPLPTSDAGTLSPDTGWNNRDGFPVDPQMTIAHTEHSATARLFDSADLALRRARQLLS